MERQSFLFKISVLTTAIAAVATLYTGFGYGYGVLLETEDHTRANELRETFLPPLAVSSVVTLLSLALSFASRPRSSA